MDEKNGGPLSVLHVSKRGIFRFGFQNLGETLLGVLLAINGMEMWVEGLTWRETCPRPTPSTLI